MNNLPLSKKILALSLMVFTAAVCACTSYGSQHRKLDEASSLMATRPDSSLRILRSIETEAGGFDKSGKMRWHLLTLVAENKCDTVFRSDSIQQLVADYYDRHGTPNERMLAHYLLGRAYSDMGDAPRALRSYQDAACCADTADSDCDFHQLGIVYIQSGYLFFRQYLPNDALECFKKAADFALQCGDSMLYLNANSQSINAFHQLNDRERVDSVTSIIFNSYKRMGNDEKAVKSLGTSLYYNLVSGDTAEARYKLNYILQHIGYDRIVSERGWSFYNAYLGRYYLLVGKVDSAEYHFRKLLQLDSCLQHKVFAYNGLMNVYHTRGNTDSVMKYSTEYCRVNDSSNIFNYSELLKTEKSLYQYSLLEKEALLSEAASQRKSMAIVVILFISFALILTLVFLYIKKRDRMTHDLVAKVKEYNALTQKYSLLSREMDDIKADKSSLEEIVSRKESELAELARQIEKHEALIILNTNELEDAEIVDVLHKHASRGKMANVRELKEMREAVERLLPSFTERLKDSGYAMSYVEENICYLIRMGFSASETSVLLNISPQSLSYYKKKLLKELFKSNGGASELIGYLAEI